MSRFSVGKGRAGSQTRRKARRCGGALGHLEGGPQPRGRLSKTQRLPLPRPVAITSCVSSSPTPALATSAAAAAAASSPGALIPRARAPLPLMCPPARAQSRGPAPRGPEPPPAGARLRLAHAPSAPALAGPAPLWSRDDAVSALLCSLNVASRRRVTVGWRALLLRAVLLVFLVFEPLSPCSSSGCRAGDSGPRGSHAGGLALEFEKEADWRMLNPDTDTPGVPSYLSSIQMRWGKVTIPFYTSIFCLLSGGGEPK